ncbi:transposase [Clostridium sp. YIM B02555]|uniref:transposase n=1 Tax=Clostridium sp. YIM B02555 TaxID=2911968 RepID=UPI001EEEE7C3|nr:transposase [Clostridium sp. YIM B02555]
MGIAKETKRKKWTFEEKLRIVNRYFNENLGIKRLAKEENMDFNLLNRLIQKYINSGELSLQPKKHP